MSSSAHPVTAIEPATLAPPAGVSNDPKGDALVDVLANSVSVTLTVSGELAMPAAATVTVPATDPVAGSPPALITDTMNWPGPVPAPPVTWSHGVLVVAVHEGDAPVNAMVTACDAV